ncbi:MAG TPA: neuraminidase-like domain-containing protein, partial [Chitinophagaceae bacterium]|nr:neuraminidase-like domain-containing protein [Chitinophagaceae bacterium]
NDADYHHYARNTNNPSDDRTDPLTPILLNGLGISETDLVLLFEQLPLQFDANGNTKMTRKKVSLLYRHTRIAKALRLSIPDLITLIQLVFPQGKKSIATTANIHQVIGFRTWMKQTPFSLSELWFLVNQQNIGDLQAPGTSENVIAWAGMIAVENRLSFTPDGLVKAAGITKEDAGSLLKAFVSAGLAKPNGDKYVLLPAYLLTQDFTAIWAAINAGDALKAKESGIRSFFNAWHPKNVWQQLLAETLGAGSDLLQQLAAFLPPSLTDANYFDLLNAAVPNTDPAKQQLIEKAAQQATQLGIYILLFEKLKLKTAETAFVFSQPALFGLGAGKLNIETIASLSTYKKLSSVSEEASTYLQPLLTSLHTTQAFNEESIENYAALAGRQSHLVRSLVRLLPLSTNAFDAINHIQEAMDICDNLGINGYSLPKLAASTFAECTVARDIVIGAFGKYADEKDRTAKMEPYKDTINVKKRDMLCAYIIALQKEFKFEDHSQLYSYFLLDVDTAGCFRTSKVVAAISSLQLYVHRCLLNLEQSGNQNSQIADADVMASVKTKDWEQIVQEWEWRKNYRVWEANRKVFLYPENYIEPDLRDNKTALFKELEEELLQEKITTQSAEEAYKKYLTQFAELSKLKIGGSYYHEDTNTYYIFGCTHIDPYQYYVREWRDCKEWTAWEKVPLSISAPYVGAVMHLSKLYVCWVDVNVREVTKISKGNSEFDQYEYTVYLNYSYRNENGKWSAPQKIKGLYDFHHKTVTIPEDVDNATLKDSLQKEIDALNHIKQTLKGVIDTSAIDARINELENQQIK